jgi:hypothetical protein
MPFIEGYNFKPFWISDTDAAFLRIEVQTGIMFQAKKSKIPKIIHKYSTAIPI